MYKVIRIEKFNILPTDPNAGKEWKLWYRGFSYFLTTISGLLPNKLEVLFLHIGTNVSGLIESCDDFDQAISALQRAYIKVPSEVHARHVLSSRVQQPDESIDTFLQSLNQLSTDCNFSDVSASTHRDLFIRDSFIRGLKCSDIRVRLLENSILSLDDAVQQARALEEARKRAEAYIDRGPTGAFAADVATDIKLPVELITTQTTKTPVSLAYPLTSKEHRMVSATTVVVKDTQMMTGSNALHEVPSAEVVGNWGTSLKCADPIPVENRQLLAHQFAQPVGTPLKLWSRLPTVHYKLC